MKKILILIAIFFLAFVMVSCGNDNGNTGDTGNTGNTGNTDDAGDTGNTVADEDSVDEGSVDENSVDEDTNDTTTDEDADNTGDNFPNEHDGLNWSDASKYNIFWEEAAAYCQNLGGRLPTISELRTLIQNCPVTETGGECGVTDECLSSSDCWNDSCDGCEYENFGGKYSALGHTDWFWSLSREPGYNTGLVWFVNFHNGLVDSIHGGHATSMAAVCIRP